MLRIKFIGVVMKLIYWVRKVMWFILNMYMFFSIFMNVYWDNLFLFRKVVIIIFFIFLIVLIL